MAYKIPIGQIDNKTEAEYGQALTTSIITKCPEIKVYNQASFAGNLIKAWSLFLTAVQYIANRTLAKMQQSFYAFLGMEVKEATYATCDVTFNLIEALAEDYTIAAGTVVKTVGKYPLKYKTAEDLLISSGALSGTVTAKAFNPGASYRVLENTLTQIQTPLSNIESVTNTEATGGSRAETQEEAILRARHIFGSYNRAVTSDDHAGLALQVSGVYRAKCYRTRHPYAPGITTVGCKTLVIYPDDMIGSSSLIADVESYLSAIRTIGNILYVILPTWATIDMNLILTMPDKPSDLTATKSTITTSLNTLFKDWEWGKPITITDIRNAVVSSSITNVLVESLNVYLNGELIHTIDDGAVTIGEFAMPKLGTLTVE